MVGASVALEVASEALFQQPDEAEEGEGEGSVDYCCECVDAEVFEGDGCDLEAFGHQFWHGDHEGECAALEDEDGESCQGRGGDPQCLGQDDEPEPGPAAQP